MDKSDWGLWQVIIGIIALVIALASIAIQLSSTPYLLNIINNPSIADPAPTRASTPTSIQEGRISQCIPEAINNPVDISPYLNWSFNTSKDNIYIDVPDGYTFVSVTINIHNDGNDSINTNPCFWEFISDGVSYYCEPFTSAHNIPSQSEVKPGENLTIIVNYLVEGTPKNASLKYDSLDWK